MVEVERLLIVHGQGKDLDFWLRVALLVVAVVLVSWLAVGVALRVLGSRRS